MKPSILIVSYLWRDTWARCWEQPSSWLARLFVGCLLGILATVILVAFTLLERSVRLRLEAFGLNTMVVREMIAGTDPELITLGDRPDRLRVLAGAGRKIRLRQLYPRAVTELQEDLVVFSYPPDSLPWLAQWLTSDSALIYVTDALPEQTRLQFTLLRQPGVAAVHSTHPFFRPLSVENYLLVPQGWSAEAERLGFIETTLFERATAATPMNRFVDSVQRLYALDRRLTPQVQSALPLIKELERLQSRQKQWRTIMAALLGVSLALVYGAIAVLEFRQNLYVGALLRSLGAPSRFLYLRHWAENGFLANVAAMAAIAGVACFHQQIFGTLGFPRAVLDLNQNNPYWSTEIGLIMLCVNIGAFLSTLPVAVGLRQPVGTVLN